MSKELYDRLKEKFSKDAMTQDKSRNKGGSGLTLTSIKSQYIVERMNEVFGFDGWDLKGKYEVVDNFVVFVGDLYVGDKIVRSDMAGAGRNWGNLSDAYKSAKTEVLSKACSWIGIGNEVFKGNVDPHTLEQKQEEKESTKLWNKLIEKGIEFSEDDIAKLKAMTETERVKALKKTLEANK